MSTRLQAMREAVSAATKLKVYGPAAEEAIVKRLAKGPATRETFRGSRYPGYADIPAEVLDATISRLCREAPDGTLTLANVCSVCGDRFESRRGAKTCSPACRVELQREIRRRAARVFRQRHRDRLKKPKPPIPCRVCGRLIENRAGGRRYCSEECAHIYQLDQRRQRKTKTRRGTNK